jgi:hypothetical protein
MTHNASLVTALQLQTESQGVSRKIAGDVVKAMLIAIIDAEHLMPGHPD